MNRVEDVWRRQNENGLTDGNEEVEWRSPPPPPPWWWCCVRYSSMHGYMYVYMYICKYICKYIWIDV